MLFDLVRLKLLKERLRTSTSGLSRGSRLGGSRFDGVGSIIGRELRCEVCGESRGRGLGGRRELLDGTNVRVLSLQHILLVLVIESRGVNE